MKIVFNNNNNIHICIAPYGRNFRGAGRGRIETYILCSMHFIAVNCYNYYTPAKTNTTWLVKHLRVLLHSWTHIRCQPYNDATHQITHNAINDTNLELYYKEHRLIGLLGFNSTFNSGHIAPFDLELYSINIKI